MSAKNKLFKQFDRQVGRFQRKHDNHYDNDPELYQAIACKIIGRSGDDLEGDPQIVIKVCNFPDPDEYNYSYLLQKMLCITDEIIGNGCRYTGIVLCSGGEYRPSWPWLIQAYKSLGRKYRKNIKKLFLVHETWWVRVMFDIMSNLTSPKFAKKVHHIGTLSELASFTNFTSINIPPRVYMHNLELEHEISMAENGRKQLFGVAPSEVMDLSDTNNLPKDLEKIFAFVASHGTHRRGVFRVAPSIAVVEQVRLAIDRGNPVSLTDYEEHVSAALMKLYFRLLPDSLFPRNDETFEKFQRSAADMYGQNKEKRVDVVKSQILQLLGRHEYFLFLKLVEVLRVISDNSDQNKMDARNLAACIGPSLIMHPNDPMKELTAANLDTGGLGMALVVCIENFGDVFGRGLPPPRPVDEDLLEFTPEKPARPYHPDVTPWAEEENYDNDLHGQSMQKSMPMLRHQSEPVSPTKTSMLHDRRNSASRPPSMTLKSSQVSQDKPKGDMFAKPQPLPRLEAGKKPVLRSVSPERLSRPSESTRGASSVRSASASGRVTGVKELRSLYEEKSRIALAATSSKRSVSDSQ